MCFNRVEWYWKRDRNRSTKDSRYVEEIRLDSETSSDQNSSSLQEVKYFSQQRSDRSDRYCGTGNTAHQRYHNYIPPCSRVLESVPMTTRKLAKLPKERSTKSRAKSTTQIGRPQNFTKGSEAADLLHKLNMPTIRGGDDGNVFELRTESPGNHEASVISVKAFVEEEYTLPPGRNATISPRRDHGQIAHPLRLNPPEPPYQPPPPPQIELEESNASLQVVTTASSRVDDSCANESACQQDYSVTHGNGRMNLQIPIIEQAVRVPSPDSEPLSSTASSQGLHRIDAQGQIAPKAATRARRPREPDARLLEFEVKQFFEIWQQFKDTKRIDLQVSPSALDDNGSYTWTHCWGIFNVYTLATSHFIDLEFADYVMDKLCESIQEKKPADRDTICLIFGGGRFSSKLKRLVVDRCVDGGLDNFKGLPSEFTVMALEATMERLKNKDKPDEVQSTCRYHRHNKFKDCYRSELNIVDNEYAMTSRATQDNEGDDCVLYEPSIRMKPKVGEDEVKGYFRGVGSSQQSGSESMIADDIEDRSSKAGVNVEETPDSSVSTEGVDPNTEESSIVVALSIETATCKRYERVKPGIVSLPAVSGRRIIPTDCARPSQETKWRPIQLGELTEPKLSYGSSELRLPGSYPETLTAGGQS